MRPLVVFAVLCVASPCLAQRVSGPPTLENLTGGDGTPARRPVAVDDSEPATPAGLPAGRVQGSVTRPKDGVQHPDLDAAWAEYNKQIETAAKAIEQAIEKELNAAAAAGDLDASLKWKTAGEQFQRDGRIPEGLGRSKPKPAKPEASPQSRINEARERLAEAYETAEKTLVKSHDLEKAKQVRAERVAIGPVAAAPVSVVIDASNYKSATPNAAANRDGTGVAIRQAPKWDNLTVPADSTLLWDVSLPRKGDFFIHVMYASGEARPCDIVLNGKVVAGNKLGETTGGFMRRHLKWETLGPVAFEAKSDFAIDPQTQGPHLSQIQISSDPNPK